MPRVGRRPVDPERPGLQAGQPLNPKITIMTQNVELDYAMLAEWARVNANGTLTVIDGSFLKVVAPVGSSVPLSVVGRVRFLHEPYEAQVTIELVIAGGASLTFTSRVEASETSAYGEQRRHVLFAFSTHAPVLAGGRCKVSVLLDGALVRELYYMVLVPGEDETPR